MYLTKQEKARQRLKGFSKKNFICEVIILPVRGIFELGCLIGMLFGGNIKKIGVSLISLLLFPVFSSFSFGIESQSDPSDWTIDFETPYDIVSMPENIEATAEVTEETLAEESVAEPVSLEVEVNESGEIAKEELYNADDIISEYLDSLGEDSTINNNDRDYTKTYEDYEFDPDDWRLILINKSHFIPDDYDVPLGTIYGIHQCDERIIPDLIAMLQAAKDDGVSLSIKSPYRTSALQVLLYNNKITKFMDSGMSYLEAYKLAGQAVTIPGASEHEAGLSLDIVSDNYNSLTEGFGETASGKWLAANAHYYGFILRYPAEKEYITTIEYEPWHFRYVGVEAATVMYNENLTLEEFWENYLE